MVAEGQYKFMFYSPHLMSMRPQHALSLPYHDLRTRSRFLQEIIASPAHCRAFCAVFGEGSLGCGLVCVDAVLGRCTLAVMADDVRSWQDDPPYVAYDFVVYDCVGGDVGTFVRRCEAGRQRCGPGVPKTWVEVAVGGHGSGGVGISVGGGGEGGVSSLVFDTLRSKQVFGPDQRWMLHG